MRARGGLVTVSPGSTSSAYTLKAIGWPMCALRRQGVVCSRAGVGWGVSRLPRPCCAVHRATRLGAQWGCV